MPKRFTDTEIWSKAWFRKLSPAEKCAWEYITNKCDNVGVWDADFELAEFCISEKIDWDSFKDRTNGNIEVLPNGKWWLVDFISFQHGDFSLDSNNHAHKSYVSLLVKHGLLKRVKETLNRPLPGVSKESSKTPKAREREKAREKERAREKEKDVTPTEDFVLLENEYFKLFKEKYGEEPDYVYKRDRAILKRYLSKNSVDKLLEVLRTWFREDIGEWHGFTIPKMQNDYNRIMAAIGKDKSSEGPIKHPSEGKVYGGL